MVLLISQEVSFVYRKPGAAYSFVKCTFTVGASGTPLYIHRLTDEAVLRSERQDAQATRVRKALSEKHDTEVVRLPRQVSV